MESFGSEVELIIKRWISSDQMILTDLLFQMALPNFGYMRNSKFKKKDEKIILKLKFSSVHDMTMFDPLMVNKFV